MSHLKSLNLYYREVSEAMHSSDSMKVDGKRRGNDDDDDDDNIGGATRMACRCNR